MFKIKRFLFLTKKYWWLILIILLIVVVLNQISNEYLLIILPVEIVIFLFYGYLREHFHKREYRPIGEFELKPIEKIIIWTILIITWISTIKAYNIPQLFEEDFRTFLMGGGGYF